LRVPTVAFTIALATIAIALFIARHRCRRCHHPLCCHCRRHHSPATLVTITITLFVAALLHYEKLWYLFYKYLHVSPGTMQKCMLHDSVRYQNTRSRDPITLLSMDIKIETFLEIGVSDLLVSTHRLQDPLYMEV
jgi:hypothetical protein